MALCSGAQYAASEQNPLPEFGTCMNIEIAQYERALGQLRNRAVAKQIFDIGRVDGVEFCGTIGIVRCDRSDTPLPCQNVLTQTQEALRAQVLMQLPPPPDGDSSKAFPGDLYAQLLALAHGISAGPDCAGTNEVLRVWCETREANGRLRLAVQAWQIARYLDQVVPAIEAGWASPPPPLRPRARPEGNQ